MPAEMAGRLGSLTILLFAFWVVVTVVSARLIDRYFWRKSLVALRVRVPRGLTVETVSVALSALRASTRREPIVWEVVGTHRGITHYVLMPRRRMAGWVSALTTTIPGIRLTEDPAYDIAGSRIRAALEWRSLQPLFPLEADTRSEATIASLLSALYPLHAGEEVRLQWILCATRYARGIHPDTPGQVLRQVERKQATGLMDACGRVSVRSGGRARGRALLARVVHAVEALNGPHAALRPRWLPSRLIGWRMVRHALPVALWPVLLSAAEAAALLALPVQGVSVPGLPAGSSRQLPPPIGQRGRLVIGQSNYPGAGGAPLRLAMADRLRHVLVQGPTGVGKSELLARMALQDIDAGHGALVIDPKADLIESILTRIPAHRLNDVVVLDPSATGNVSGFNILRAGRGEHARELSADRVVHIFSQIWRSSWGPRTADVLRSCVLTLTHARALDGQSYTLAEIPDLLLDDAFRRFVVARSHIPDAVRQFWSAYEEMSPAERNHVIGPLSNKIRALTSRTALRLVLGQSQGIDMSDIFRKRKILLVPLSQGVIGQEAAHLLGSLLVAMLWQETLSRSATSAESRDPVFAYLDEFQSFVRMAGDDLAEMFAQARGLGLGLTVAYQYLDQLPSDIAAAVLGTVRSQIMFAMEWKDAETMAKRFTPWLGRDDLTGLGIYEFAMRPCIGGITAPPATGRTLPLNEREELPTYRDLITQNLNVYGASRTDIEDARAARLRTQSGHRRIGRDPLEWREYDA